jgi:putative hydrolase of the HAD superfamily
VIRLVTLDFWQTLFADTTDSLRRAHALRLDGVRRALAVAGHPYDAARLTHADAGAGEVLKAVWGEHRDVTPEEQLRMFLARLDPVLATALATTTLERVARAYQEPTLIHRPEITHGAAESVRTLRNQGVALGVISNTGRTPGWALRRLLGDAGLLDCFAVLAFSDEVGVRKPAAAIFHGVLDRLGIEPAVAVHVGDDPVTDVAGARGAGMRAIHYVADPSIPTAAADGVLRRFADLPTLVGGLG